MEIEKKTACTSTKSPHSGILASDPTETPTTSADLMRLRDDLKAQLHELLIEGRATEVVAIRERLEQIPVRLAAVQIRETKGALDQIQQRFSQIKSEKEDIIRRREVPVSKAKKLMDELTETRVDIARHEIALFNADSEEEGLHEKRRELQVKLKTLVQKIEADVEAA